VKLDGKLDFDRWCEGIHRGRCYLSEGWSHFLLVVDGKPIRASRRSAEWCLKGVDQCWSEKERTYKADEKEDAKLAYEHARQTYRKILAESEVE
jgi:hypothetical protein